ncbi:MAG: SDR family oxidoreductase, partial [Ferruginibacter sp.]
MKEYSSPFSVNNNNYLITGASSGIGRSLSILLSRSGANLILIDIDEAGLLETKSECKDTDKIVALDLRRSSEIKVVLQKAVIGFGKLHGFVHLAGKPYISPLKSISEKKCEEIFLLNTYAVLELAKYFINRNIYAGERGSIVLISSIYALVGSAANIGYAMSKSALHGITKSLAIELAPKKIRVNC